MPARTLTPAGIEALFMRRGAELYSGEPVTQLEHALQTAHLAEQSGAGDALVSTNALYHGSLSADSKRSLVLQGGVFDAQQAQAFIAQIGAADAVQLRQWDDLAKQPALRTPPLKHFLERASRCAPLPRSWG